MASEHGSADRPEAMKEALDALRHPAADPMPVDLPDRVLSALSVPSATISSTPGRKYQS